MPIQYLRRLTSPERTDEANRTLGQSLAFVAGAANAGGFLAVRQYTSHMSGIVSAVADDLVLGDFVPVLAGVASLLAFLGGAACTAVLVNWGAAATPAASSRCRCCWKRPCCWASA